MFRLTADIFGYGIYILLDLIVMPTRKEKIAKIHEVINPDREASEKNLHDYFWDKLYTLWFDEYRTRLFWLYIWDVLDRQWQFNKDNVIHWHIVWERKAIHWKCTSYNDATYNPKNILDMRKEKRKPIGGQSDDCIDFIYSLVTQWQ